MCGGVLVVLAAVVGDCGVGPPSSAGSASALPANPNKCDSTEANDMEAAAVSASSADHGAYPEDEGQVPVDELARRQGERPIKSVDELAPRRHLQDR